MEIIPIMDRVISEEYVQAFGPDEISSRLQVRTYNLFKKSRMRELNPEDIGQLITLKGFNFCFRWNNIKICNINLCFFMNCCGSNLRF